MNETLIRAATPVGITYKSEQGVLVKFIANTGSITYKDPSTYSKSRSNRECGGPCIIHSNGTRLWMNYTKKNWRAGKFLRRGPTVGNNRNGESSRFKFTRIEYGISRRVQFGVITYSNPVIYRSKRGTFIQHIDIKRITPEGDIIRYDNKEDRKNGPDNVYSDGFRSWTHTRSFWESEGGNPKKTWGNKDYIMERYEYPKT